MDNVKQITPELAEIQDNTPALKIGNQFFINGIGGNYVPGGPGGEDVQLGQIIEKDGVQKFVPMIFDGTEATEGTPETFTELYTYNTANPTPEVSGGGTEFYKCASVDTINQTWTGYKAILDSSTGYYSFESNSTAGLTYTDVTPAAGGIYSADAKVTVAYLNQLVPTPYVYLPLSSDYNGTVNGETVNFSSGASGTLSFDGGRLKMNPGYLSLTGVTTDLLQGDFTICLKINQTGTSRTGYIAGATDCYIGIDDYGGLYNLWAGYASSWRILQSDNAGRENSGNGSIARGYQVDTSLAYVHDGNFWRLYVNGKLSVEKERTGTVGSGKTLMLGIWGNGSYTFYGKMWDFRLYQSALSVQQINQLIV